MKYFIIILLSTFAIHSSKDNNDKQKKSIFVNIPKTYFENYSKPLFKYNENQTTKNNKNQRYTHKLTVKKFNIPISIESYDNNTKSTSNKKFRYFSPSKEQFIKYPQSLSRLSIPRHKYESLRREQYNSYAPTKQHFECYGFINKRKK